MKAATKQETSSERPMPKSYHTPTLTEFGTITELTQGTSGLEPDNGAGAPSFSPL